jgi:hypothetical protein
LKIWRVKARRAWIRSRFSYINESDKPTKYVINLEKRRGTQEMLSHLKLPDGQLIDDDDIIRKHARLFYQDLYSPDHVDDASQQLLLEDLPQLPEESTLSLDEPLTCNELALAVRQVNNIKSPGIDGLPY